MLDHDFEKQVHQKMEALQLSPSDTVWERVEEQLHKKKRRRILFWIPLLLLSLVAGGYYLTQHNGYSHPAMLSSNNQTTSSGTTKRTTEKTAGATNKLPEIITPSSPPFLTPAAVASPHTQNRRRMMPVAALQHPSSTAIADNALSRERIRSDKNKSDFYQQKETGAMNEVNPEAEKTVFAIAVEPINQTDSGAYKDLSAATVSFVSSTRVPFHTAFMVFSKDLAVQTIKLPGKKSLHWGIQVEAMRTAVHEGGWNKLFGGTNAADFSAANLSNISNPNNPSNGTAIATPSPVRAGIGFSAGFFLSKKLSQRLTVSTGIDYALFTTSVRIDSIRNSSTAQFNSSGVNRYFPSGNGSYTNRFHFLELPVSFQLGLNKGKLPLVWEGGGSVAWLLTSNALQFSNQLNGYYKSSSLLKRTQLNLFTGFYFETFSYTQHPVRIGPQVEAGLSNLSASNGGKRSYFTQVGFKITTVIR